MFNADLTGNNVRQYVSHVLTCSTVSQKSIIKVTLPDDTFRAPAPEVVRNGHNL